MKDFWLLWTYQANYSESPIKVSAANEVDAASALYLAFGGTDTSFFREATVFVFTSRPILTLKKGRTVVVLPPDWI